MNTPPAGAPQKRDCVARRRMASHASSSRFARAPDVLPAEDAPDWDRL